jgi:hypothetical protein
MLSFSGVSWWRQGSLTSATIDLGGRGLASAACPVARCRASPWGAGSVLSRVSHPPASPLPQLSPSCLSGRGSVLRGEQESWRGFWGLFGSGKRILSNPGWIEGPCFRDGV